MQDHERPSILAVGLPEIFDNAERESNSSADSAVSRMASGVGNSVAGLTPRITSDPEMLRWMIYSAKKQCMALQSEFGAANFDSAHFNSGSLRISESLPTCDDSAFGLTLGATLIDATNDAVSDFGTTDASDEVSFIYASSAKRAIELLRIMRFDLLVTGEQLPDMSVSQLVGRVRAVRPWQKWALVMSNDSQGGNAVQSEIAARSLGAAAIFDAPGDLGMISELAQAVAARQPAKMAVGGSVETSNVATRPQSITRASTKGRKTSAVAKGTRINRAKA